MSSAIPYDPEAEANPFASETPSPPAPPHQSTIHDDDHEDDGEHHQSSSPSPPQQSINPHEQENIYPENHPYSPGVTKPESGGNSNTEPHNQQNPEQQQHQQKPQYENKKPVKKYKLITKITALERQGKKDPIIRFDAYTTLPRFRTTTFKDIRRTHHEFVKFFDHLNGNNPECFVPSVPPATTSAGAGTEEDETKVKLRMQLWLDRVTSNPILARDEEFLYFIEADFGYSPVVKRKPPATGLTRKAMKQFAPPPDETELKDFRPLVKNVFLTASDAAAKLEKVTKHRRSLGLAMNDFGLKTGNMAELEQQHAGMVNMWRKLGKVIMALGDTEAVKATSEAASLGDGINWIAKDAYVAKEALTNRHLLMKDLIKAQSTTKTKHQTAVRVRGSSNLSALKVDEAITALEEATQHEERLTNKVRRVTDNMLLEKNTLVSHFESDIKQYVGEYVLRMIESERRALTTWESVRIDVRAADSSGGLSRLGRESTPANRRAAIASSQGPRGDSWSGDRSDRAPDFIADGFGGGASRSRREDGEAGDDDEGEDELEASAETAVDARNAASLLAGSTF